MKLMLSWTDGAGMLWEQEPLPIETTCTECGFLIAAHQMAWHRRNVIEDLDDPIGQDIVQSYHLECVTLVVE